MDNKSEIEKLKEQIEELKGKVNTPTQYIEVSHQGRLNQEEKDIYEWEAPVRIFVKWEKQKIITTLLILGLLALLLIYLQEPILLFVCILLGIVSISLTIFPPSKTVHKITNKGVFSFHKLYLWEDLVNFWIAEKKGTIVMYINTKMTYPSRLFLVIPRENIKDVVENLSNYLKYYDLREAQGSIGRINDGLYIKYNDIKNLQ